MEKFTKTVFYKRNLDKHLVMSRNIKTLKVGDIIKFFGKLYTNKKYITEVAQTIIIYKILAITSIGVLIETTNKYIYDNGTIEFIGKIFSQNFNIENNIVQPYTTTPEILIFKKGTKIYQNSYGYSNYHIAANNLGHSVGKIKIKLKILK